MLYGLICGIAGLTCLLSMSIKEKLYLTKVDELVNEKLRNPVPGEGDYVLDSLQIYLKELNTTVKSYIYNGTGQDVVDMLIEQKGPKCVTVYLNDHVLQAKFKWGAQELGELYYYLSETKMLWRDLRYHLTTKLGYKIDPIQPFFNTSIIPTELPNA